jgi:hypothetical protein
VVSPEGRESRTFAFDGLLTALNEARNGRCYSKWYPKNSRSLTTFSCLTNTTMRRRRPLPFPFASLRCQRRSRSIYRINIGRALPAVDSIFLRTDRHGTFRHNACLLAYREPRKYVLAAGKNINTSAPMTAPR